MTFGGFFPIRFSRDPSWLFDFERPEARSEFGVFSELKGAWIHNLWEKWVAFFKKETAANFKKPKWVFIRNFIGVLVWTAIFVFV